MNFKAFVDSLGIMGRGMLGIFVVMLVIWALVVLVRKVFH